MTNETYAHYFSSWVNERLAEIDATLTSVEGGLGALRADARKQAEKAVWEIRAQRDVFREAARKQQYEGEAPWAKAKTALDANWISFEAIVQQYMIEARQNAAQPFVSLTPSWVMPSPRKSVRACLSGAILPGLTSAPSRC